MTISSTTNRKAYTGDGSSTSFSFPYYVIAAADLKVYKNGTLQTLTTHYTLSGTAPYTSGTNVQFVSAPASDDEIVIVRDPAATQQVDLVENDPLPVETSLERPLDRLTMLVQRLADLQSRSLQLSDTDVSGMAVELPAAADRPGGVLGFDADGELTIYEPSSAVTASENVTFTPSGTGATASDLQTRGRLVVYVQDFGAVADGTTDDGPAFNKAIAKVATNGGTVRVPAGTYKISTTIAISTGSDITIEGDGVGATTLTNGITDDTAAEPCIKITTTGNYISVRGLSIVGNGTVGAGGNGHGISMMDTRAGGGSSTWSPQGCAIDSVLVEDHFGFGKDASGNAMDACGVYIYATLDTTVNRLFANSCKRGLHVEKSQKSYFRGIVSSDCTNNCLYLDTNEALHFLQTTLNQSGDGGTTDGLVFVRNCFDIKFEGGRWKNADPYVVNMRGTTFTNSGISFEGIQIAQLDGDLGHTIVGMASAMQAVKFANCEFEIVGTITDGIGIDINRGGAGFDLHGFVVDNCRFTLGAGATYSACIKIGVTTDIASSPVIRDSRFGLHGNAASATTITKAIYLTGLCDNALIENNVFAAMANVTITDCLHIDSNTVRNTRFLGNSYLADGTITNKITNSGTGWVERVDIDFPSFGFYTPTLTAVANVDASTAYQAQWSRVGQVVTVAGKVDIDPNTTATLTQLGMSLPVTSNLTLAQHCGGTFSAGAVAEHGGIYGDTTNDRATLEFLPTDVANRSYYFTFTYLVR